MKSQAASTIEISAVNTHFVCPLDETSQVAGCGEKAYHLGGMRRLGLPVPGGVVVTNRAFQELLDQNELRTSIAAALASADVACPESLQVSSQAIGRLIMRATIPADIMTAVRARLKETIPSGRLAVRSSAVGEDSAEASFAGQLDSLLNVSSDQDLERALLKCWASYWSERSLFYQRSQDVWLQGMGILIQRLVDSQVSGVLFSRNPGIPDVPQGWMVAEYCRGFGDGLVAGSIDPGRFAIARDGSDWRRLAAPDQDGSEQQDRCLFNRHQISRFAQTARLLEREFEGPQDIEWTIDRRGRLHVLQSRPITVCHCAEELEPAPVMVWSNANVNENFPAPISPLLYSIAASGYYHYFRNLALALGVSPDRVAAADDPLRRVIGVHGARMYYNLTNIHALLRMMPFGELLTEWFNGFVGARPTSRPHSCPIDQRSKMAKSAECGRIARKAIWLFLRLGRRVAKFEQTIDEFAERTAASDLKTRPIHRLGEDLRALLEIRCHRWLNASLADAAAMISYGILKKTLNREFPDRDLSSLHNSLLKGLRDVVSSEPVVELWRLSRMIRANEELSRLFDTTDCGVILRQLTAQGRLQFPLFWQAFEDYLESWGFRCSGELMLTTPSLQENPQAVIEMLKAYRSVDSESPLEHLQRQESARTEQTRAVLKQLRRRKLLLRLPWPTKATLVRTVLAWTHRAIAFRERARLKQALLYSRCRQIALAIGARLVDAGRLENHQDIFFLTYPEIDALVSGSAMFPDDVIDLVRLRREAHDRLSAMSPPERFELGQGRYLACGEPSEPNDSVIDDETELSGVGACGGRITAPAAVLRDVSQCGLLSPGDVLVTRQTDPGWAPVFFLIKGLVIERGGMLSHGAILAREYGIPTVVGVKQATRTISPGQTICVNGDRGVVQLASA